MNHQKSPLFPKLCATEKGYLLLCFCIYLFWALTFTGASYGPDETMRYDVPYFIYTHRALPVGVEDARTPSSWGFSYGLNISAPYVIGAMFMGVVSRFTLSETALLVAARMTSVLSMVGVAWLALTLARRWWKDDPLRWVFVGLLSLLPQLVFLSSYFNLDAFSLFAVMLILYGWVACLERRWDVPSMAVLSTGLGLCLLSYEFAYSYVLMSAFVYAAWAIRCRRTITLRAFLRKGLFILALTFILCGWKFIRSALLYDGDLLTYRTRERYQALYAIDELKPQFRQTYALLGRSIPDMLRETPWIETTWKSLIGCFGYMMYWFAPAWYAAYLALFLIGLAGCAVGALRRRRRAPRPEAAILLTGMVLASAITVGLSVYYSWKVDYQPQGRYVVAALPLLALTVAAGLRQWRDTATALAHPSRKCASAVRACVLGLFFAFVLSSVFEGYYLCLKNLISVR